MTKGKGVYTVRHFRQARGDEGAAAVEFALLFPIFMILAMGIINGGFAFSRQINVTQAAREAARYGATYDIIAAGGMTAWLNAVDDAARRSAGNGDNSDAAATNPIGGYDYRCVALVKVTDPRDGAGNPIGTPAVDTVKSSYKETNGTAASTTGANACPSTAPALIRGATYVQVVLSRNVKFFVVFISPTIHLDAVSSTPYEGDLP